MANLAGKYYIESAAIRVNDNPSELVYPYGDADSYYFSVDKLMVELQVEGKMYKLSSDKYKQYIDAIHFLFTFDQAAWDNFGFGDTTTHLTVNASFASFVAFALNNTDFHYYIIPNLEHQTDSVCKVLPVLVNKNHILLDSKQGRLKRGYKLAFLSESPVSAAQIKYYTSR